MVEALHTHARTGSGGGYSHIKNVNRIPTPKDNYQPPDFLGGTLKYLYMIFMDDSILPLDQWVFNTVGQPLPIKGSA